jgi:hypothetical protein
VSQFSSPLSAAHHQERKRLVAATGEQIETLLAALTSV